MMFHRLLKPVRDGARKLQLAVLDLKSDFETADAGNVNRRCLRLFAFIRVHSRLN
jgi:hypothetical protein